MRGQAVPAGHVIPPGVHGYDKALDARLPFDVAGAKQLLAEAGYPDGFDVRLDCTNDRYLNDEAICQAVVNMLARAGIKVSLDLRPRTIHMPKLQNDETDFYLLGWGAATMDAHYHLDFLAGPRSVWNRTGFADTAVIALIDALATEQDVTKRDAMLADASRGVRDSYVYLPLHHQMIAWATRKDLEIPIAADNQPQFSTARFVGR
jgi:peptide/nickel transport system substrate-binding protein